MKPYKRIGMLPWLALAVAALSLGTGTMAYGAVTGQQAQESRWLGGPGAGQSSRGAGEGAQAAGEGARAADEGTQAAGGAPVVDGVIQPQNLEAAKEADQMIVVVGTGGCNADTYYYTRKEDAWDLVWKEASIVGRGGITLDKAEGDGSTPAGTYGFTMAFGLKEDPGSALPYHKVVKGDYWVDDSNSPYYNQLVNTSVTPKSWSSAENLAAASPYYNYALALNYNPDRVPGKGSAIFLHCFTAKADNGSSGCIRLPESRAKELVQAATGKTRIVIAADMAQLK